MKNNSAPMNGGTGLENWANIHSTDTPIKHSTSRTNKKRGSKPFVLTSWHRDILRAILALEGSTTSMASTEGVRREMFGVTYPNWQMDSLRLMRDFFVLQKQGYIEGVGIAKVLTEKGLSEIRIPGVCER